MADNALQFDPGSFNLGPERQLVPQGDESQDWFHGYYELERSERFASQHAAGLHRPYFITWYRLLDAYYRALDVPEISIPSATPADEVWLTGWKILRLGICAAKGALDATLAGYYVGAFGEIRQMTEYWFGIEYLVMNPASVARFYRADEGKKQKRLSPIGDRIHSVLDALSPTGTRPHADYERFARLVHKTYKRMSDGHHLDGLAIVQTGEFDDAGYYLGAGYHASLVQEALYHGTLLTGTLALTAGYFMGEVNPNSEALTHEIGPAMDAAIEQLAPLDHSESGDES